MKEISRWIFEYLAKKWKSLFGLVLVTTLIIITINQLSVPYKVILTLSAVCIWFLFWILRTGRLILPSGKYTAVFCIKTDDGSDKYYKKVFQKLRSEIDSFNVSSYIHFLEIEPDIIKNRLDAENYRENQGVDLVIWGNAYSETAGGKIIVNFKLNFTFKINETLKSKLLLFSTDLLLITGAKKWIIDTDNTLYDEIRVANSFREACIFILVIYLLTENRPEDSIKLISSLRQIIPEVEDDNFRKLIQGRLNSILVEAYLLIASEALQKKDYRKAKKYYLELMQYPINKFRIYAILAKIEYHLDNLSEAFNYTKRAAKEQRKHPVVFVNYAFFRILEKKYVNALIWYKKIFALSHVDLDIPGLLEFLEERYNEDKKEYAYLFAMGLLNFRFFDKARGIDDLSKFRTKTKALNEYMQMNEFSQEIINAERYRKKIVKKIPGKKKK